jgi:predicted membrane chloride channel (bestrophin family)
VIIINVEFSSHAKTALSAPLKQKPFLGAFVEQLGIFQTLRTNSIYQYFWNFEALH